MNTPVTTRSTGQPQRTSGRRFITAALVAVVGLLAATVWGVVALVQQHQLPGTFPRTALPGTVTVQVESGAELIVYTEAPRGQNATTSLSAELLVANGQGSPVDIRPVGAVIQYDAPGAGTQVGTAIGALVAPADGALTVTGGQPAVAAASLAVGPDLAMAWLRALLGPIVVGLATVVLALVLAVSGARSRPTG